MNWEREKGISPHNNTHIVFKILHILSIRIVNERRNLILFTVLSVATKTESIT